VKQSLVVMSGKWILVSDMQVMLFTVPHRWT